MCPLRYAFCSANRDNRISGWVLGNESERDNLIAPAWIDIGGEIVAKERCDNFVIDVNGSIRDIDYVTGIINGFGWWDGLGLLYEYSVLDGNCGVGRWCRWSG